MDEGETYTISVEKTSRGWLVTTRKNGISTGRRLFANIVDANAYARIEHRRLAKVEASSSSG